MTLDVCQIEQNKIIYAYILYINIIRMIIMNIKRLPCQMHNNIVTDFTKKKKVLSLNFRLLLLFFFRF